jgi:hypothetical protein
MIVSTVRLHTSVSKQRAVNSQEAVSAKFWRTVWNSTSNPSSNMESHLSVRSRSKGSEDNVDRTSANEAAKLRRLLHQSCSK